MVAAQHGPDLPAIEVPGPELPAAEDPAVELAVAEVPDSPREKRGTAREEVRRGMSSG